MQWPLLLALLELLVSTDCHASIFGASDSNLTYFGAPRFSIKGVLPVFDIAEGYIRSQTDNSARILTLKGDGGCSRNHPCALGSCCNSDGQCGYRPEHCSPSGPKQCVADCDAKAPCGEFSADGKTSCPLNVCCSHMGFCGTSDLFCDDMSTMGDGSPCLGDNCSPVVAPSCGKGSGTASRRVAYYQSWNTWRRSCDKVLPSHLDTSGLTHLVFAFATIDPKTFQVGPMNPEDEGIYKQFLALPDNVSKWIGIGGFEFTDPGATHYTWSDMTSTKENRGAFIDSLRQFLSKWNFSGVDIDWEWPGHESRGGRPQDGANQVQLFKEMRQALGGNFGLGVVIPAQYEYMKNMDIKSLESQVDWLTILTYDLHGPWNMNIPGLGPYIKPHTDLKEIDDALKLLWFNNIDSKKINMGIANYGRGYTVADKDCMYYGCRFTGPSKAGSCTLQDGVLSTCEIRRLISEKKLASKVITGGAEANEVTWDDQWVSFDDASTLGKKLELANDRCLGGTALWAIDYATCSDTGTLPHPEPGSSIVPSLPTFTPASSAASSGASPIPSSQPSPEGTSVMLSFSKDSSTTFSSAESSVVPTSSQGGWPLPSSPVSSAQASSQVGISESGTPPSTLTPALSGPSSNVQSFTSSSAFSSAPLVSSISSLGSSAPQASTTSTAQASPGVGSSSSQASTGAAVSSLTADVSTVPVPVSSSLPSSVWSSSHSGESGQISSTNQPVSSEGWTSSVAVSSVSSIAWSSSGDVLSASSFASSVALTSTSSVAWSSSAGAPSSSSFASSVASSVFQASSATSSGTDSNTIGTSQTLSSSQAKPVETPSQGSSMLWSSASSSASTLSGSGWATWSSPSPTQTVSIILTSSAAPSSSSRDQFSSPHVPSALSSGSSVAQSSEAQSSKATPSSEQSLVTFSSAAQSSNAASSKTTELSQPAGSLDTATPTSSRGTTMPPSGSSGAASASTTTTSFSITPPISIWCPDECREAEWCRAFCGATLSWPPPPQCWWFDWCMLWWGFAAVKRTTPEKPECKLLGCGCGWMGLPWGPGCPGNKIPFPINIVIEIFGLFPVPCLFFGCGDSCGILGCGGWCFGKEGCIECPKLLCPHGGPKPGPIPSNFPPVDPPAPTGSDGKPKACEAKDYKTATERLVFCGEFVYLSSAVSATTVSSIASTSVTTSTSSSSTCHTPLDITLIGCNVKDYLKTETTSVTKSNSLSSETPGPACTRAPLSLDDDEGNNILVGWDSSSITFASNTTTVSSPTSTPTPDCSKCWEYFDKTCIPQRCKTDDLEYCAFRCLSDMCLAPNSPEPCFTGHSCAHKACPNDTMGALPINFTATLTFADFTTLAVTIPSSSAYSKTNSSSSMSSTWFEVGTSTSSASFQVGTSEIPKPIPGPMDKNGSWKVSVHLWMENKAGKMEWELYDPNGNKAGEYRMDPREGNESIETYIESYKDRASEHSMPFGVKAWYNSPTKVDEARVEFEIQKSMPNCDKIKGVPCKPKMETENKLETKAFFVDVCFQYCDPNRPQDRLLDTWDLDCQDLNDAEWEQKGNSWMRNFDCHWKGF